VKIRVDLNVFVSGDADDVDDLIVSSMTSDDNDDNAWPELTALMPSGCCEWLNVIREAGEPPDEWDIVGMDDSDDVTAALTLSFYLPKMENWLEVYNALGDISREYPLLEITHEVVIEKFQIAEKTTMKDGVLISEESYEWDSDEGIALRESLGCDIE
jgi:hypothetical protein